jgi:hypothetical protein
MGPHPHRLPALASLVPLVTGDYPLSEHSMMPDAFVCFF